MRKLTWLAILCVLALAVVLSLSSCYLFVGSSNSVVPLPGIVRVLSLPQILGCSVTPIRTACENLYERVCGWYFWTEPGVQTPVTGWVYRCRDVWLGTDCWLDLKITLTVSDPSDDLDPGKSPRVRVFDSEPSPGGSVPSDCLLDVPRTDIVIGSTEVTGSGPSKTVSVRLRDVRTRFAGGCSSFSATLRFALVFNADGEELSSSNTCETVVECRRP